MPLFSHALATPGRPQEENRAIFTVLCAYVLSELDLADLLGPLSAELEPAAAAQNHPGVA